MRPMWPPIGSEYGYGKHRKDGRHRHGHRHGHGMRQASPSSQAKIHVLVLAIAAWTLTTLLITGLLDATTMMSLSSSYRITSQLWDKIVHFASFPQTPGMSRPHTSTLHTTYLPSVSLQQMALFGQNPSQGTLLKASQFLSGTHHTRQSPAEMLRVPSITFRGTTRPTGTSCTRTR